MSQFDFFNISFILSNLQEKQKWPFRSSRQCIVRTLFFNPFPNTPFGDRPKFKEAADDICNVPIKGF